MNFTKEEIEKANLTVIIKTKAGKLYKGLYRGESNDILPPKSGVKDTTYVSFLDAGSNPKYMLTHVPKHQIASIEFGL